MIAASFRNGKELMLPSTIWEKQKSLHADRQNCSSWVLYLTINFVIFASSTYVDRSRFLDFILAGVLRACRVIELRTS